MLEAVCINVEANLVPRAFLLKIIKKAAKGPGNEVANRSISYCVLNSNKYFF